ncbi:hypothetical protein Bbelb_385920 [Branchiostoma belcheri]|nr:hypothetical protein Bbelb_385920 [Branchiostoma belcheri]
MALGTSFHCPWVQAASALLHGAYYCYQMVGVENTSRVRPPRPWIASDWMHKTKPEPKMMKVSGYRVTEKYGAGVPPDTTRSTPADAHGIQVSDQRDSTRPTSIFDPGDSSIRQALLTVAGLKKEGRRHEQGSAMLGANKKGKKFQGQAGLKKKGWLRDYCGKSSRVAGRLAGSPPG